MLAWEGARHARSTARTFQRLCCRCQDQVGSLILRHWLALSTATAARGHLFLVLLLVKPSTLWRSCQGMPRPSGTAQWRPALHITSNARELMSVLGKVLVPDAVKPRPTLLTFSLSLTLSLTEMVSIRADF